MSGARVLVTGASGFVGGKLVPRLAAEGAEVLAVGGSRAPPAVPGVRSVVGDLQTLDWKETLAGFRPDVLVHLAALSSVGEAARRSAEIVSVNLGGALRLAQAVRAHSPGALFILASSQEAYGSSFRGRELVDEAAPLLPLNAYGRSKAAAEWAVRDLLQGAGPLVVLRLFPHTGPGQDERFVVPAFAAQIARIEAGRQDPVVRVGNLAAVRDFTDVEDVLEAYLAVIKAPPADGTYNVCSGRGVAVEQVLANLRSLSKASPEVEVDPSRSRPAEIARAVGDPAAIERAYGWRASTPLERTLEAVLEDQRERLRRTG